MPVPPLSQSTEAARATVAQAEFNEKKWVWVPDAKEGYLSGWVHREEEDAAEVIMAGGGEHRRVPFEALFKMNPPKFDRVEDIADLTFLNEASVVHNLKLRYGSGAIYTYSGLFLVAINPYQNLPLYSDAIIQQYRNKRRDENPPHIFAVAERAWVNMGEERENQSILITGESGAGKTESTKKVIQYLAAIAADTHLPTTSSHSQLPTVGPPFMPMPSTGLPRSSSLRRSPSGSHLNAKGRLGLLERQILQANPILEAFGNAQTQRNNNSSRFGKFVRITFAPDGSIAGANIDWYLLEKSRVVVRNEAERSFHVFYQLLAGGALMKDQLLLGGSVEDYEYLNKSRREVDGVDDREEWNNLKAALDLVGFSAAEQLDLFRVVAAILHIGNIEITSTRADDAVMPDPSQAERVCHILGIPMADFNRAVLRPQVLAGREWVSQARTRQQAMDELGALCKTLYEKSFGSLVDRVNRALDRPSSKSTFIGVLDIAGFEIFETNTYEQLLINYTNEKLQQFFNHHMFVLEQEEYTREGINWDYVNFGLDLQPTIDLIEASGSVIGILSCLDEECIMPKATDLTFTNKLNWMWAGEVIGDEPQHPGREKFELTRFEQGFIVQHYAAKVEYRTDGWLEKNKDPLNENLTRVLASSSERYIASLFSEFADMQPAPGGFGNMFTVGKKRTLKKGAFRTVGQRHKEQLSSLMLQLRSTQPHFVRCIVPNSNRKPGRIDVPLVLDQLRCNGVLEGIRIARLGYPNRLLFVEFRQRYEILTPGVIPRGYMDGREACRRMVGALELDETLYKIGTSKIFFKAGVLAELEERRDDLLFELFSRLQAAARMWTARRQMKKVLNRAIAIKTIQRNARIYAHLRDWPWWQLYTKVRPLLAATRSDDELRRKETELALIKERAEQDKQEREALENLKMSLEAEKRKVEDELEAERALTFDKDALLERSKKREGELEDEIAALQADLDVLDSQLDRAMKLQRETEDRYATLSKAFDQAAEHLVRLEDEQKVSVAREAELATTLASAQQELDIMRKHQDDLQRGNDELKNLASQRQEDLSRAKERMAYTLKEVEGKLAVELRNKDIIKARSEESERDARQAKEQLAEMARTATDYLTMIQKKEEQISKLADQLTSLKTDNSEALREIIELQSDIDTLVAQLDTERGDRMQDVAARKRLQEEIDQLRSLMEAKTSEESRRNEVEKRKEEELADLRKEVVALQHDLAEARRSTLEGERKLRLELEHLTREHNTLLQNHKSLSDRETITLSELSEIKITVSDLERTKRSAESELQLLRTRQYEVESQLADAVKVKEGLERQLNTAQAKYRDFEDVVLEFQRTEKSLQSKLDMAQKQLDAESSRRSKLEQFGSNQKVELGRLKDQNIKMDRELKKALKDLKEREWEIKQLESKQDKTVVEHVHVLEEAKRVTDRQLEEARKELEKNAAYIRSLEKAKTRLDREAEDLARNADKERVELRNKEKNVRAQEEKAVKAAADVEVERRAKEAAELQVHRLQAELQSTKQQVRDFSEQVALVQRSKENLESRKALVVQQRAAQEETELQRAQLCDFTQAKKQLQADVVALREQLEIVKNEESDARRQLAKRQQEEISLQSSLAEASELRAIIENYKSKEHSYQERLEAAEVARAKAARGEAFARRALSETEKSQSENAATRKLAEERLQKAEIRIKDLEMKLEEEGQESSDAAVAQKRLQVEIEDERGQHLKDLAERDFTMDQTRKKYQAELAQLSEELQSQRDSISRIREENRKIRSEYDELQLNYDEEAYNSGGWKKEKERLKTKVEDVTKAFEASTAAQAEQQSQIVALHSQVRELRSVLDDAEADRALLQKARRALQAELETIKLDNVDTNKFSSDQEFQRLQLKKLDLERSLEEQEDRVTNAFERMKRAETYANECQIELGKVRVENSELDKSNASLEKQVKELNVRIVDLETRSYSNSPRPPTMSRRAESRLDELGQKSADKVARDTKFQLTESERARAKLEEERKTYEAQLQGLREEMDAMQTEESNLQAAKRRAEREAVDFKQRALSLERELERLRGRLERPSGGSPRRQ